MTAATTARSSDRGLVTETVAVLGAGSTTGFPVARNIARAGMPVRAWDPVADRAEPLAADGAYLARTPREAATGAGIVITVLADGTAVTKAMTGPDGALAVMPDVNREADGGVGDPAGPHHALWLQLGTIGEAATKRCAELANRAGVGFVDAPALGNQQAAAEGALVVLESGPEEARPRIHPIFDAIARRTIRAGQAGAGTRLEREMASTPDPD